LSIVFGASSFLISLYGIVPVSLCFSKDARTLSPKVRQKLEAKVTTLAKKLGITKQLELVEVTELEGGAKAEGNALLPGRAGILIDPALFATLSESEQESLLAHELVHIASSDLISFGLLGGLVGLVTTVALQTFFEGVSLIPSMVGLAVSYLAIMLFSRYREECADKKGFAICSDEGKRAAVSLFTAIRQDHLHYRNDPNVTPCTRFFRRIVFSKEGNDCLDPFHPSLSTRIAYLTALQRACAISV
jgi:Zn-dependent protease with chaperone function